MDSERDPQKERMRTREVGEGAESHVVEVDIEINSD
jgi:hypothetical protein